MRIRSRRRPGPSVGCKGTELGRETSPNSGPRPGQNDVTSSLTRHLPSCPSKSPHGRSTGYARKLRHRWGSRRSESEDTRKSKGNRSAGSGRQSAVSGKRKAKPKPVVSPEDQANFLEIVADSPAVPAKPSDAVPGNQIGAWDQCVCILCEKHLAGFQVAEHTKTEHNGKDPGYRVVGK